MRFQSALQLLAVSQLSSWVPLAAAEEDHVILQRSLEMGTWAGQTRGLLDDFSTCNGCQNILSVLKGLVKDGDESLITLGQQLCRSGTSYDAAFCEGVLKLEGPVIAELIRTIEINSTSAIEFCITFLGVCKSPALERWAVPFPSKKACDIKRPGPAKKDPIKIIHYSDIHIDPLYVEGSSTECKKPTCCRSYTKSDEPGTAKSPAGPNGDHNCDVPKSLERSMYKAIHDMFPDQAFSIFTGDIVDHALFNTSQVYNEQQIDSAYGEMDAKIKLVYGTAGNHESHPSNIFELNSVGDDAQWVYDALTSEWSKWIGDEGSKDAKKLGAYSVKYPNGKLRIISLNTNMYYRFNFALYQKNMERDPNGQIAWLVGELDAAEQAGDAVYIIGHMPLGEKDALPNQSNYLDQVVKRYSSTIRAMFFGHTHVDHFELSYSDYSKRTESNALVVSYICPSLTPTSGMPSFRVYDVDPDSFTVLDATTYYADMDDPNFQKTGPVWKKFYSAKEAYGSAVSPPLVDPKAELTPAFWHKVTESFENNQTLFDEFIMRKSRGWKAEKPCQGDCRKEEICQLRAGRSQDNCFVPKPGVNFSKREETHNHGEHDDCGNSVARDIFHALAARDDLLHLLQDRFVAAGAKVDAFKRSNPERMVELHVREAEETSSSEEDCTTATSTPTATGASGTASASPSSTGGAHRLGFVGPLAMLGIGALAI